MKAKFEDMRKRNVMWDSSVSQEGTYDGRDVPRSEGIAEALKKISTEIMNRSLSDW